MSASLLMVIFFDDLCGHECDEPVLVTRDVLNVYLVKAPGRAFLDEFS